MKIIERVLFELDKKTLKKADLCHFLGIGTNTLSTWKTRGTDPPAKYIAQICEFLNVSTNYLLTGKETEKKSAPGLTEDEQKVLNYYGGLKEEQKDYIKGEMARLNMANRQDTEFSEERAT